MNRYWRGILFSGYVVAACLLGGELAVRGMYGTLRDYNMEMWRYASDLKLPLDREDLPFHHRPGKAGTYYGAEIRTNALGLRDRECSLPKPPGERRIVMLGDSFTLGWGVEQDGTFACRLEEMLNSGGGRGRRRGGGSESSCGAVQGDPAPAPWERERPAEAGRRYRVINMGTGNYNTVMEVELFKWKGLDLDPDVLILMYFLNDPEPVPRPKSGFFFRVASNSYLFAFLFDRVTRLRSRLSTSSRWDDYYAALYSAANSANLERNREAVRELASLCRDREIDMLIVNIPDLHETHDYRFSYATDHIRGLAVEVGTPFLDLLPAVSGLEPESLWVSREDHHANAGTNETFAERIYAKLLEEGLVN